MKKLFLGIMFFLLISSQLNVNAIFDEGMMLTEDESERINTDISNMLNKIFTLKTYNPNKLAKIFKKASPWLIFAAFLSVAYSFNQQEENETFCWDVSRMISNQCSSANGFSEIYNCIRTLLIDELKENKIKCTYVNCMKLLQKEELFLLSRETQDRIKQCILDFLFRGKYKP